MAKRPEHDLLECRLMDLPRRVGDSPGGPDQDRGLPLFLAHGEDRVRSRDAPDRSPRRDEEPVAGQDAVDVVGDLHARGGQDDQEVAYPFEIGE